MADSATSASDADLELLDALRKGDEAAFMTLVDRYQSSMKRIALLFVSDPALADEVIQDAWIGVLRGLSTFQGRSSLKTWIFSILTNRAKTIARREGRYVPLASSDSDYEPAVSPDRFDPPGTEWAGHWTTFPASWDTIPEARLLSDETQALIRRVIDALPPGQMRVIVLRDVEGWSSEEICNALEITETNQRVLLHRARSKVRQALEDYFAEGRG
jgi:RNA polymerase sigma-70 factor (ECF subfamily)